MATYRAIETISDVLMRLLQASYAPDDFDEQTLQFSIYQGSDFSDPMGVGVSLFLYRLLPNGVNRTPPGRVLPNGDREKTRLPIDLHYLLTVWAGDATMQQRIAGWVMRTLEDTPILPRGVLSAAGPQIFAADETIEIVVNDLTNEDLFRIWDTLDQPYHLSIPYLVRNVHVESEDVLPAGEAVRERLFELLQIDA